MQSLHSDVGGGLSVRAARDPGAYPALSQGDQGQEQSPGTDPATQRSLQVPSAKGPFWAGAPSSAGSLPSLGVHCTPPGPWQTRRPPDLPFHSCRRGTATSCSCRGCCCFAGGWGPCPGQPPSWAAPRSRPPAWSRLHPDASASPAPSRQPHLGSAQQALSCSLRMGFSLACEAEGPGSEVGGRWDPG